jgi:hypothetical protein
MTGDFALTVFEEKMGELLTAVRSWTPKHEMSSFLEKKSKTSNGRVLFGSDNSRRNERCT